MRTLRRTNVACKLRKGSPESPATGGEGAWNKKKTRRPGGKTLGVGGTGGGDEKGVGRS